jgi:hypothetical protein
MVKQFALLSTVLIFINLSDGLQSLGSELGSRNRARFDSFCRIRGTIWIRL